MASGQQGKSPRGGAALNEQDTVALLLHLIPALQSRGSWCGETHVQKAVYFVQHLFEVPLGFEFILYKFGPFSFDLRSRLESMRATGLVHLEPYPPYGPSIGPTALGTKYLKSRQRVVRPYSDRLERVARLVGDRSAADLERLSTALFVTRELPKSRLAARIEKLTKEKPHIDPEAAERALRKVDELLREAG